MPRLITNNFKIHIAEQIVESLSEIDPTNMYLFIGKTDEWDNEENPPGPTQSIANTHFKYWDDMLSAKKIKPGDVKHIIPRIEWSFSSDYFAYTHDVNDMFDKNFYVVTDDNNVYKCLQNNLSNGFSTVKPTGTGLNVIETSDGYKWKYMYTIKPQDILKFSDDNFIPVQKVTVQSVVGNQRDVEDSAVDGAIDIISKTSNGYFKVFLETEPVNNDGDTQDFIVGETLYSSVSDIYATLEYFETGNTEIIVSYPGEKFSNTETIKGLTSGALAKSTADSISTYVFSEGRFTSVLNSTAMFLSSSADNQNDNIYVGSTIYISNNAGQGEQSKIIRYDSQSRRIITQTPFVVTPNTSSGYIISPSLTVKGDGVGATARTLGNATHGITSTLISNKGYSYRRGTAIISANSQHGQGATAKIIIGPVGGHGKNAIEELNGNRLMIDTTLTSNEFGYFTTTNDYRQFGILRDPLNSNNEFYTSAYASQMITLELIELSGRFLIDEKIYVGETLESSTANGFLVDFTSRSTMRVNSILGDFSVNSVITGNKSGATAKINVFKDRDMKPYSGDILYIENKKKVQRVTDQVENYKIILEF